MKVEGSVVAACGIKVAKVAFSSCTVVLCYTVLQVGESFPPFGVGSM